MLSIRPATIDDVAVITQNDKASRLSPFSEEQVKDEILNPNAMAFVAVFDGRVAGHIIAWIAADEVELHAIAVLKEARRAKAGSALIHRLTVEGRNRGGSFIYLETRSSNAIARSFYKAAGFVEIGQRKKYYTDTGEDAILLKLDIREI